MGVLVEFARQVLDRHDEQNTTPHLAETAGPILAVKICGSLIGDYWLVLSDDEPFDPGDGQPIYRPSEMKAMLGKGYGPDALQAVHRVKTSLTGRIVR